MFSTTRWTVVFEAARESRGANRPALGAIVEKYWKPLYFVARHRGLSPADAEDAAQSFFEAVIQGDLLEKADPAKGRFRTYLMTAWKRYLIDVYRHQNRQKRGADVLTISMNTENGEREWLNVSTVSPDPDLVFNRGWASNLIEESIERLRAEYASGQRTMVFNTLLPALTSPLSSEDYARLATSLAVSMGATKVALHRLRQRFAQTLREVVEETVEDPADIDSEMRTLLEVVLSGYRN